MWERLFSGKQAGPSPNSQLPGSTTWKQLYHQLSSMRAAQKFAPRGGLLSLPGAGPIGKAAPVAPKVGLLSLLRRAFSSGAGPKKGFEKFKPKGQNGGGKPSGGGAPKKAPETPKPEKQDGEPNVRVFEIPMLYLMYAGAAAYLYFWLRNGFSTGSAQEISFQEFKRNLLPKVRSHACGGAA